MPTVLVVECDPASPLGRLDGWLTAAGADLHVVRAGDLDPDATPEAILVLGGLQSADDPGLADVRQLLALAVARETPVLAICLGAQLLALANGGRVEESPDGPELGAGLIAKRGVASNDPLLRDIPITPDVVQWHFDAITHLPPGAHVLAGSPACEVQAFRLGRLAWGFQFHVEATADILRGWADADLDDDEAGPVLARTEAVLGDLESVWRPVIEKFVAVVSDPDAVPAPRQPPTSTAPPLTDPAAIRAALAAEAAAANRLPGPVFLPTPRPRDS